MKMRDIKKAARKNRGVLMTQFNRLQKKGITITEFANMHNISRSRMSSQLRRAAAETGDEI